MEGGNSSFNSGKNPLLELEMLQKEHGDKMQRIQELRQQIAETKIHLEKKKKEVPEEKMEAFKTLTDKYNRMRDEYNALLADKLKKAKK
ncbi:hypothetical protein LOK49_LG15G02196 [Camellia lanceoleosa]|uniref:Uncharacterized protein n=1 Tax=Camellia lanceoleosa TaxID=1840588 RepID=A0ACC0F0V6_9ERIC|nr:hypothetical protein LOK49_LG15G02196 [Camellia lanceoleosa]